MDIRGIGLSRRQDNCLGEWIRRKFTPKRAVFILTFVLFLNYVDRGIVAGAGSSIKGCVASEDLCGPIHPTETCLGPVNRSSVCEQCRVCGTKCKDELINQTGFGINTAELGLLQSMFMVGYIVGAIVFAQLANKVRPFRLISLGLFMWILASVGSGIAGWLCNADGKEMCWSFYLMVFTRALSGVGEASINTLTLPFLDDVLEPKKKGFYIGIYYTAIPVGTAVGFMWAGAISSFTDGEWEWAFLLEAPIMIPFAILLYYAPFSYRLREESVARHGSVNSSDEQQQQDQNQVSYYYTSLASANEAGQARNRGVSVSRMTLRENIYACLSRPAFVLGCLGYAAYTAVVAGLGFYGPLFIQSYRPCDKRWDINQATADVIFGSIISISGFVGTIVGGFLVDRIKANPEGRKNRNDLLKQLIFQLSVGLLLSGLSVLMHLPILFFLFLFLGSVLIFMVSAGINMMLLWTVPKENRPMSSALAVLAIHLFGDVPSPILIGYLSDTKSPLFTLTATVMWLLMAVVLWVVVLFLPVENIDYSDEEDEVSLHSHFIFEEENMDDFASGDEEEDENERVYQESPLLVS